MLHANTTIAVSVSSQVAKISMMSEQIARESLWFMKGTRATLSNIPVLEFFTLRKFGWSGLC